MRNLGNHETTESGNGRPNGAPSKLGAAPSPRFDPNESAPPPSQIPLGRIAGVVVVIIVIAFVAGLVPKLRARKALVGESKELSVPTVSVVSPGPGQAAGNVSLPAEVRPFVEAPIYAQASGYLKRWLVDIGDRVEANQLLAEIAIPEVEQELARAHAELDQAEAALALAKSTSARWADLLKTSSVSEQEAAEKQSDLALKTALLEGARASMHRIEETKGFALVRAPFAGSITARRTDVGQLISANNGKELFRLAQMGTLRVFVRVPQALAHSIEPGQHAELVFAELAGEHFDAKVVRTAGAMEPESRTLLVELQVDNAKGQILAGSYAQVRFIEARQDATLTLPSNTLLFRSDGMQLGIVEHDGTVSLRPVQLGRDFGKTVEILAGVSPTDHVILNPPDSVTSGMKVRVAVPSNGKSAK